MSSLDIYLSSLSDEKYKKTESKIGNRGSKLLPLFSWDFSIESYHKRLDETKREMDFAQVLTLAKQFNWKNDLNLAFQQNDYEALIITDKNQKIIWVNDGFSTMTGYPKAFAINKTPRFLQGANTFPETKERIRKSIERNMPFKDIIINHRKDNSPYKCEVKIFPLYNKETTHFIAFEREVG